MLKKVMNILLWILLLGGVIGLTGFAETERNHTLCKQIDVKIMQNDSAFFITPAEIRALISAQQGEVTKKSLDKIDVKAMEEMLKSNAYIDNAQVFATPDGVLHVSVAQKKPMVRVISAGNESYYLDTKGNLMPLSPDFTALVMVVNGKIKEPYARFSKNNMEAMQGDTSVHSLLPSIYKLSGFIYHNPVWKALIPEIYVDSAQEFCLIPRVGNQRIIFGDSTNMQQKFARLWVLYRDGFGYAGKWNDYSQINLKYNHQIVCTKK
jgi:cell division protein FtsQ